MSTALPRYAIVGSGTAGLISALMLRQAFPNSPITVVSSSQVGIIGVGEGSTEHWRQFMDICEIPLEDMITSTAATHKYGIRFEGWTDHTPDYFHSIGSIDDIFAHGLFVSYMGMLEQRRLFTTQTSSIGLIRDKINRQHLHNSTNQFHFDTFKLNDYFVSLCFRRNIRFIDGIVDKVNLDPDNGTIASVGTAAGEVIEAEFWIDATGFRRELLKSVDDATWVSFSDYLLTDSAIAFPTESDPNGRVRPYTRARAASSGWMWEIPTQERRGNGYVFSSKFISADEAVAEAQKMSGYQVDNPRVFSFDAGYMARPWMKNCCAVGLASAFVEPLEATSIGSTIQQVRNLIPYLASYAPHHQASQRHFNANFAKMMENILVMIRLHYWSDRRDSAFWQAMAEMPVPEGLQEMIDLWSERPPCRGDFDTANGQLFAAPHFAHVAQGQGIIPPEPSSRALDAMVLRRRVDTYLDELRHNRHNHELVDHGQALREISALDSEWQS